MKLLLGLAVVCGCYVRRPYPPPTAQDLRRTVAHLDGISSLRAETRVDYVTSSGHVRVTVMMLADEGRLRLDVLSPVGTASQTLIAKEGRYELFDAEAGTFEVGEAAGCGLRVLPIPLTASDASRVLRGGTMLLDGAEEIAWDGSEGAEVLRIREARGGRVQEVRLRGEPGHWRLLRCDITNGKGDSELRIDWGENWIRMRSQTRRQDLRIHFRHIERNPAFSDELFRLVLPPGVRKQENMICDPA